MLKPQQENSINEINVLYACLPTSDICILDKEIKEPCMIRIPMKHFRSRSSRDLRGNPESMMKPATFERCVHTESTGFLPKRGLNVKMVLDFFQEDQ